MKEGHQNILKLKCLLQNIFITDTLGMSQEHYRDITQEHYLDIFGMPIQNSDENGETLFLVSCCDTTYIW